jgi:hypothetical protein
MSAYYLGFDVKNILFCHFSAIFKQICKKFGRRFFWPLRFLWNHFCVLQPKYLPVGNTVSVEDLGKHAQNKYGGFSICWLSSAFKKAIKVCGFRTVC